MLFYSVKSVDGPVVRANGSSWYVKPAFRSFASLLITLTTRDKSETYFNISPAPHTWSTVEAQGFSVYCKGQVYGALALSRPIRGATVEMFSENSMRLSPFERDLLTRHAAYRFLSVVVRGDDGDHPYVFQRHWVRGIVPVFRLIYCRSADDFAYHAGHLGRFLLLRGGPLARFDSTAARRDVFGWYSEGRGRMYAKGKHPPRIGDLAFTEAVQFDS